MKKTIYRLCIFVCAVFLWTVTGIASPDLSLMAAFSSSLMEDNIQSLPFGIPLRMNTDSSLFFPNANSVRTFRYSGGEEILVYQYLLFKTAVKDMENFSSGRKEQLTKKESAIAAENNMVITGYKEKEISGVFFILDTYIVGILTKESLQSRETIIRAGEKIIASYNKYLENFYTPEKCMATLIKSIEDMDMNLTMDCFYFEPMLMGRTYKNMMTMYLSSQKIAREQTEGKFESPDVKIKTGKIELVSDFKAKVEITEGAHKLPISQILPLRKQTDVWLPLRREGRKWMVDVGKAMEFNLAYSKERAEIQNKRAICRSNLRQLGLVLRMYASDNKDKMPEDVRQLFPNYLPTASTFKCPGDSTIVEPKKIVGDTPISYTYVKGLSKNDKNASKIVILYETSSENHEGKGRHVLFLDGNVAWHSEESFQQLLTQQEAFLPPEQKPVEQEKKIPVPFLYPPEIRETRLTLGPFIDRYPVWSADGKRIAFIRSVGDRESLCIIDKTGCIQNNISLPFSKITFMNWAPGKEKILIISGGDIYTVDARNESVDKLTEAEGYEQAKWMQNEEIICLNDKEEYWKILQIGEKNFIQKKARKNLNTLITGDNLAVHSLSYRMHTHNLTTNSIEEWKQQVPSNSFSTNFSDFYSPDTNKFVFNAESPYRQLTSSIFIVGKDGGIWRYDIGVKTTLPTSVGLAPDKSGIVFAPWRDGETCISLLNFICSGKSEIRGFIPTEDFRRYKLEYGLGTKPTRWHLITDWKNEIPRNEVIAIWDTKTLKDGVYSLMITVETKTGHFSQDRITVQVANEKN